MDFGGLTLPVLLLLAFVALPDLASIDPTALLGVLLVGALVLSSKEGH